VVEPTLVLAVAVGLMALGAVGSLLPVVPSGLLSLAGVYVYVLFGAEPVGPLLLVSLTAVGLLAAALEQLAGPIAAKASGASTRTAVAAGIGGFLLFLLTGPIGIIVGMFGVVFLMELADAATPRDAARRSVATVLGLLASSLVQFLLTLSVLVGFLLFVVVL
jgi:uncharacterized protein YqgC (DUF456 family)